MYTTPSNTSSFAVTSDVEETQIGWGEVLIKQELEETADGSLLVTSLECIDPRNVELNNEQDIKVCLENFHVEHGTISEEFVEGKNEKSIGSTCTDNTIHEDILESSHFESIVENSAKKFKYEQYNSGLKVFDCSQCNFVSKYKNNLVSHTKGFHGPIKFKCKHCYYTSKYKHLLTEHINSAHGSNEYKCKQCDYITKNKNYIRRHITTLHGSNKFRCKQCDFTAKFNSCLKDHVNGIHGLNKFKCGQCDFTSIYKRSLTQHINGRHGSSEIKCTKCDFTSKYKSNLRTHINGRHGSSENKCTKCDFTSKYKSNLKKHINGHHDSNERLGKVTQEYGNEAKPR